MRALIVQIRFGEYANKRELLEQIRSKVGEAGLTVVGREKLALMLRCFLNPDQSDVIRLQAAQLLLFGIGDSVSRLAALEYLASYLENKTLNYAERGSLATVIEALLAEKYLGEPIRDKARYLLFIADPQRLKNEEDQKALLSYLRGIVEGAGFANYNAEKRVIDALGTFMDMALSNEKFKKAAQYLEFKIKTPQEPRHMG